jgi:hypothetical protein
MKRVEKLQKMSAKQFKRIVGTTKPVFQAMQSVLQADYVKSHVLLHVDTYFFCKFFSFLILRHFLDSASSVHAGKTMPFLCQTPDSLNLFRVLPQVPPSIFHINSDFQTAVSFRSSKP